MRGELFFFFSSRRRHTRCGRDWSSDVCSSDLVTILDAGRATLEISDPPYAAYIDEVEVGRRVAGPIRVAFEVADAAVAADAAEEAGARVLAQPTRTPWNSSNARLEAPAGLQITLFAELGDSD